LDVIALPDQNNTMPRLSVPEFVERWKASTLSERAAAQSHFIDLCEVLGQPRPAEVDQTGDTFTFEKHVSTLDDGKGFADVWKRGFFGWEYKGKHKNLNTAYGQLVRYQGDLENPPLLVTCDQDRFEVHTNFTGTRPLVYSFALHDLLTAAPTPNCALPPLEVLRAVFTDPELLRPDAAQVRVTEHAAEEFAKLADSLERRGVNPEHAAHFLMRLLFCLFADSTSLLPDHLFRQMIARPENFTRKLKELFGAMATKGSTFGPHDIHYFNGGLFADDEIFELTSSDLSALKAAAALDWSEIEPAIFGTLFERGLDPGKRSQLGAHHTSKEDILLVIEPVIIEPLRQRWEAVKMAALGLADAAEKERIAEAAARKKGTAYPKLRKQLLETLLSWVEELAAVRVLDPACGSGNFLYLALRRMLDLWHEVRVFCAEHGLPTFLEKQVHPSQLYGLETNVYAQELASVVVWIGYLQWLNQNGIGWPTEPILRRLDNIQHRDAIFARDPQGNPIEPEWPEVDFIIGNPPFLGGNRIRGELGDKYVEDLFRLYTGRVPPFADLVCYWFEKARAQIQASKCKRAGLLATQGIRGGVNRVVLERIKGSGSIFMAWSDRPWVLDGAAVHVSIIGFDNGSQAERTLDGKPVSVIHANLTSEAETTSAAELIENSGICFMGPSGKGPFDVDEEVARVMLNVPININGRPNSDVVRPVASGVDLVQRSRNMWTIDFGTLPENKAAEYEKPFEYVREHVYPVRSRNRRRAYAERWWLYAEPRIGLREATKGKTRYIATPAVSKHRIYTWVEPSVLCNQGTLVFAREDDYFFGVLHSRVHEIWARAQGTQVREVESGFRYTPTSTFETFPFPWPPSREPKDNPLVEAIAEAARELVQKRNAWLIPGNADEDELKNRTLTNLYNARPSWLAEMHRRLDSAVLAAYDWSPTFTDAEVLERLLRLNHERAG
jgi:type II restriction/modification system DNA methylase subunit YeeA